MIVKRIIVDNNDIIQLDSLIRQISCIAEKERPTGKKANALITSVK